MSTQYQRLIRFDEYFDRVSDALSSLFGPCLFKVSGRVIFSLSEFWI